jgi:hypothetical protein
MTDIERLRADLVNLARECDGAEGLGSGIIAHRIRCIVVDHFTRLTADYERLRGMEERVKGLHAQLHADYNRPEGRWGMHGHSAVDDDYFSALEYVINKLGVALVPVPGGEGK